LEKPILPSVLNLKSDEIDTSEKRSKYTVTIVGCGQKGILFGKAFADAGFEVVCSDADPSVTKRIVRGKTPFLEREIEGKIKSLINSGQLTITNDIRKAVSQGDIIIITIPSKVDEKKKIDFSETINVCKQIGAALHESTLVIYSDIASLGLIEGIMKETLENTSGLKVGQGFGLAYNPIHNSDVKALKQISGLELKVAGIEKTSLDAATIILKTVTKETKQIRDIKTAEIATLFAVAKKEANIALANELAVFCEDTNTDYFEVSKLSDFNCQDFGPTTVEEENKNEAYLLFESAENLNAKLKLSAMARKINEDMVKHAVNLTQSALKGCGKTVRRAKVAVLGKVYSSAATSNFIRMLELKGTKTSVYDPVSKKELWGPRVIKNTLNEVVEGTDCIVILTREEQFRHLNLKKLKPLMKTPSAVVDLAGALEPQEAKMEGFIYRGLGRGTREK
jgi:UDP-N-acetyl-D-mannosaminuronic acid dehydrogenase